MSLQAGHFLTKCLFDKKENKLDYYRGKDFIDKLRKKLERAMKIINYKDNTHFIINQLAEEFNGNIDCIGENMEKYIPFSVPINKKCDDGKTITHKLRFIDSFRFMNFSLSDLVDNLSGIIFNSIVCMKFMEREKINSECCFVKLKNDRLIYRCRECKKKYKRPIGGLIEVLIKKFSSIYQFFNSDLNEFIFLLRKGVYPYEDIDNWEKFDETT